MRTLFFVLCFMLSSTIHSLSLKPNSPERYVVRQGDSLWGIANRYLVHPWEWKALWNANPSIKNPSRLHPGDVLVLSYYQSAPNKSGPYIRVLPNGTVKLSPRIRSESIDDTIPPIPLGDIKPFLNESLILDQDVLRRAPYIVAFMAERLRGGQGDEVYVKGLHPSKDLPPGTTIAYSIFHPGKNYIDPITKCLLGYKATLVGYGALEAPGEPATMVLTSINEGIQIEDRVLINNHPEFELFFEPSAPSVAVKGLIIEMPGGMPGGNSQEAVGEVIVINLGEESGIKPGNVLGLYSKTRVVKDPRNSRIPIRLPQERVGEALVFRTFTKASYALIVRSTRSLYLLDTVTNP